MFLLVCIVLLFFPKEAGEGAREGLKIAFETLIPSIVPFACFSAAIVFSGGGEKLGGVISPVFKMLGINPKAAIPMMTGLMGGYPVGAKTVCDMYSEGLVEKGEAEKMLAYTNNGGIFFAINILGREFFKSTEAGICVFIVQVVSVLILGMIITRSEKSRAIGKKKEEKEKLPVMAVLGKSMVSAGSVMVNITASFVVFYALMGALRVQKIPLLSGIMEMTSGIRFAGGIGSLPIAALFFTFGGLSVICQTAAVCEKEGLSLKYCFLGKIICATETFFVMALIEGVIVNDINITLLCFFAVLAIGLSIMLLKEIKGKKSSRSQV